MAAHPIKLTLSLVAAAAIAACDDGDDPAPTPTMLQGTAATGAPMAGASIAVIDADAATADPAPVTADGLGRYSVDVSALKAPLLIQATATIEGVETRTVAVLPELTANADNTANVTPLTHAVAALVAPGGDPLALRSPSELAAHATPAKVGNASALVVNTLATDPRTAAALGSGFDPTTTPFAADGSGIDGVLDRMAVDVTPAGVAITNLTAVAAADGTPASVTLTPAQAATPAQAPTLPPSASDAAVPAAADIEAVAAAFNACLALPLADRVALDGAGTVTQVKAPCDFAPAGWKSNGRSWAEEVGQYTFAKRQFDGARLGRGRVVLAAAPEGFTDAKTHKHPQCNDGPCAVVRFPLTTAGGATLASDWLFGKVGGAWKIVGNHRPYRGFVEARLVRKINTNRDGAGAGSTIDPYFLTDRYESQLRTTFDLTVGNTADVRAVRVTGPGMPAAGLVFVRSQRCGTDDRLVLTYANGSTRVMSPAAPLMYWANLGGNDYMLDAARLDGSPLQMPTPVLDNTTSVFQDFAPAPVADQEIAIPAWSRYTFEVFRFSSNSDQPDEIFHVRNNAAAENAARGTAKTWPTLDGAFAAGWLRPDGANAGGVAAVAAQTMGWQAPAGTVVVSGYVFSQNTLSVANAQNETANFNKRSRLDFEPDRYGESPARAWQLASPVSGTSLSSFTATTGSNPNPRCTTNDLVPLTDNISDYREAGLTFRGSDRKLQVAIWFWEN